MDSSTIYSIANTIILFPWLLMLIAPKWKWTHYILYSFAFPLLMGILYLTCMLLFWNTSTGDFSTLENLTQLFANKDLVLIGWLHYLAFDLFVGTWELRDAQKLGISHWVLVPCLFFTLMAGPIGLLFYLLLRWGKTKTVLVDYSK